MPPGSTPIMDITVTFPDRVEVYEGIKGVNFVPGNPTVAQLITSLDMIAGVITLGPNTSIRYKLVGGGIEQGVTLN